MAKLFLIGLLAVLAAAEDSERSGRQLFYHGQQQPSIQYYFIDKVQTGPLADPDLYQEALSRVPYYQGDESEEASFRQLGIFGGLFNNRFTNGNSNLNTFRPLSNSVFPIIRNPNSNGLLSSFATCTNGNGQSGVCVNAAACAIYGGQSSSSSSCSFGNVCCINTVSKCAGTVTLNNTYFQSPATKLTTPTSCTLTVKLDKRLVEQRQAICQVRLDFVSFTLAQPNPGSATASIFGVATQCATDNFQVGGALNTVPTICGENDGQHMYLHVPRSDNTPSDVRLTFNLGTSSISRSWNIKIAMIPCAATYSAPTDCLQYYTASSGTVQSFNWKDVAGTTTRQLANQDYKICFRNEIVNNQRANSMCISTCSTTAANAEAFSISDKDTTANTPTCLATTSDYVGFVGGSDGASTPKLADRFCGGNLNTDSTAKASVTVCSTSKPFEIYYKTDDKETADELSDQGFCLSFQQRA